MPPQEADKEDEEFAIVFAAMGVNMETAHFFKQVWGKDLCIMCLLQCSRVSRANY